jgi:hypothetical protein
MVNHRLNYCSVLIQVCSIAEQLLFQDGTLSVGVRVVGVGRRNVSRLVVLQSVQSKTLNYFS